MEIDDTKKYLKLWADSGDDDFCRHALDYMEALEALIAKKDEALKGCVEALEQVHPMNPEEPCTIYETWIKARQALALTVED